MAAFSLRKASVQALILGALSAAAGVARAEQALPVSAPAGSGQQALSVFATAQGDVLAAACGAAPCSANALPLGLPPELRSKPARAEVVALGAGRRAVVVTVTDGTRTFQAVVAAPLAAGAPKVLFAGLVGLLNGQEGTRSGPMVQISEAESDGSRRVLVGEQSEGVSLCGRPTILAPRLLTPQDLELHAAKVQRLSVAERDRARQVKATWQVGLSSAAPSVLSALAASSALGAPQALTDGDLETTWSEDIGGAGKGEFVVMHAPPDLPISSLEIAIRPRVASLPDGAAPERLFIVGPRDVVAVTLPDDAWQKPGATYVIELDPPLQSSCLALVLDTAFDQSKTAKVTVAELSVVSDLAEGALSAMVARLAGGGQRAQAAKALLVAGGPRAFTAIAQAFNGLDEGGKRVALEILDRAPCQISAPVYVDALMGKIDAQVQYAQGRLSRCGRGSSGGEALAQALSKVDKTNKRLMPLLVNQLTVTDPARAVLAFMPLMDEKTVGRRRLLRTALAQAARSEAATQTVRTLLADPATPPAAAIDLLRALGDSAPRYQPEAGLALARLSASGPDFRARYLLLGPTSVLSAVSPEAEGVFRKALGSEPDPHVRAAALSLVRQPQKFQSELLLALADRNVRVREASVHALAVPAAAFASPALAERLEKDEWPLVRAAAADALARYPAGTALDKPLTQALNDDSPLVRARSVRALGERRVSAAASRVRDRLIDAEEWPEVRAEAARALGALCDTDSTDELVAFAQKLADPMASPEAQQIATAAVMALGRLAPPNLAQQLASLSSKKATPQARRAATLALAVQGTCRAARKP